MIRSHAGRALRFLDALVPYPGGKRRLLPRIAELLPKPTVAPTLLDAFLGGGSVSLWAKRRGFRVIANDLATRSVVVGRALVENDHRVLTWDDLVRTFARAGTDAGYVARSFAGDVLPRQHAEFVDALLGEWRRLGGARGALHVLLAVRLVIALRPMGNFGAKEVMRQMAAGEWERVNPSVLRDSFTSRIQAHPLTLADGLRRKINRGVFANGHDNRVCQGDALEFVRREEGDIAYLDPPYGGTMAYESALRPLDSMLAGSAVEASPSVFSGRRATETLDELIAACAHVPRLVLSYGNAAMTPDAVEALVRRHRTDVRMEVIAYAHLAAVASAETKARNLEILISAGRAK